MTTFEKTPEQTRRTLLAELRNKIIPWARQTGVSRLVHAGSPLRAPEDVAVDRHPGTPLRESILHPPQDLLQEWKDEYLLACRSPRLGCVIDGEIDWRIGVTEQTASHFKAPAEQCDYHVLGLPAGTFFLMPPGTPYSDGRRAHWDRPGIAQFPSRLFWMQILPYGVCCHICRSTYPEHVGSRSIYVPSAEPGKLVISLVELLQSRDKSLLSVGKELLTSLLVTVEQGLATQRLPQADFVVALLQTEPLAAAVPAEVSQPVRRACEFININLQHPLSLAQIAKIAGVSPTHLNRCFDQDVGVSTMRFVREWRIRTAKNLLRESDLSIRDIAGMVGYPNQSHFARLFLQMEKVSPLAYRSQSQMK